MILLQGKHVWLLVVKLWQSTRCADSSLQTKDMKQLPKHPSMLLTISRQQLVHSHTDMPQDQTLIIKLNRFL